jgi:hypothetical protein
MPNLQAILRENGVDSLNPLTGFPQALGFRQWCMQYFVGLTR